MFCVLCHLGAWFRTFHLHTESPLFPTTNRDPLFPAEAPWASSLAVLPALSSAYSPCALSAAQRWRCPCVCSLDIGGNLFHEGGSSTSCLYCRGLSVSSWEAVVRAWAVPAVFRYYFICKYLVPFWFPERRSGWVLEDSALLGGPFPHPTAALSCLPGSKCFRNQPGAAKIADVSAECAVISPSTDADQALCTGLGSTTECPPAFAMPDWVGFSPAEQPWLRAAGARLSRFYWWWR